MSGSGCELVFLFVLALFAGDYLTSVGGAYNKSRIATEINTEIVTLSTDCDFLFGTDCGKTEKSNLQQTPERNPSTSGSSTEIISELITELQGVTTYGAPDASVEKGASIFTSRLKKKRILWDWESTEKSSIETHTRDNNGGESTERSTTVRRSVIRGDTENDPNKDTKGNVKGSEYITSTEITEESVWVADSTRTCEECKTNFRLPDCLDCTDADGNPVISFEQKLFQSLFKNYKSSIRPLRKGADKLVIFFSLIIKNIIDIDERNQILKLNVQINQSWVDQILHWDPDEYGGITEIRIPATEIWVPDVTLYNTGDSSKNVQGNLTSSNVVVRHDGYVRLVSKPFVQQSTCLIRIRFFPFDSQKCAMKYGSWTFTQTHVDLVNASSGPEFKDFQENEQWELMFSYFRRKVLWYDCCPEDKYVDVTLFLGMQRRPLYYIYKLILPIVLLSALSMVGFLMPYNVGVVKANLSVTLFLSMTMFLLIVAETIPKTSADIPLITEYYITIMALIAASTAMNIVILNIFHYGKENSKEVPQWIRVLVFFYLARILNMDGIVQFWKKSFQKKKPKYENKECIAEREALLRKQRWFATRYGIKYTPMDKFAYSAHSPSSSSENLEMETIERDNYHEHSQNHHHQDGVEDRLQPKIRYRIKQIETGIDNILQHLLTTHKKKTKFDKLKREWALVATVVDRLLFIIYATTTISLTVMILLLAPGWQKPLDMNDRHMQHNLTDVEISPLITRSVDYMTDIGWGGT